MLKPYWLNKKINFSYLRATKEVLHNFPVSTVCEEARCPNLGECFSRGVVSFLILGDTCTRNCRFCGMRKSSQGRDSKNEIVNLLAVIEKLKLSSVVITSPTRDDLPDFGAGQFSFCVQAIKRRFPGIRVEVLIPDFAGKFHLLDKIISSCPDIIAHNIETVPRLYPKVRRGASYSLSLSVLDYIKKNSRIPTKSGLMLGLGEKEQEVKKVLYDLRMRGCDILTLGQYLAPSLKHYPVYEYVKPAVFKKWKSFALSLGFVRVMSSPYTRSSYLSL